MQAIDLTPYQRVGVFSESCSYHRKSIRETPENLRDSVPQNSKTKLLDAALQVIRTKGYTAATLDDICVAAGVTKGSYFHYFKGKEEMALQAVEY